MKPALDLFACLWSALGFVGELLGYLLCFVGAFFRTRASLAARLLAAESQLAMCKRRIEQKRHGILLLVSAKDGKLLADQTLQSPPVFNGMIVAGGKLLLTDTKGRVLCYK